MDDLALKNEALAAKKLCTEKGFLDDRDNLTTSGYKELKRLGQDLAAKLMTKHGIDIMEALVTVEKGLHVCYSGIAEYCLVMFHAPSELAWFSDACDKVITSAINAKVMGESGSEELPQQIATEEKKTTWH